MKKRISKKQLDLFDLTINSLWTAVKNSGLYAPVHPLFASSIKNFKTSLDKWLLNKDSLNLGISYDNILLDGAVVEKENKTYSTVAGYMHKRGIIALSFLKRITEEELFEFFKFIRDDVKVIVGKGGILKNIQATPHLKIKEIDYSSLLVSGQGDVPVEEIQMWESLSSIAEESKEGHLPESKVEFLVNFLKDTKKSAVALNCIYKRAVAKVEDESAAKNIHETIGKICTYFKKDPGADTQEVKEDLAHVISQLHPDLIEKLFDQTTAIDGKDFDISQEITKDLSDGFIADFIESLTSGEDAFNENLLKVFDKLVPEEGQANSIATIVADKMLDKKLLDPAGLLKLQSSIQEIFSAHPDSNFMSQMYKITVDTSVNRSTDTLVYIAKLAPEINKYMKSVKENGLKKEKIELLLNVIWLEDDPVDFEKLSTYLTEIFPEILNLKDTDSLRKIFDFFTRKLRPEQAENEEILLESKKVLNKIAGEDTMRELISFIPETDAENLENIAFILTSTKDNFTDMILDAFVLEQNRSYRRKYAAVLRQMGKVISDSLVTRLEWSDPSIAIELFRILKDADQKTAHLVTKELIHHKNIQIRAEALEDFKPQTEEERNNIFELLKKEKSENLHNKFIAVLLKSKDKETINKLFKYIEKRFFTSKAFLKLIELCGETKTQESFDHLEKIFLKQSLFRTAKKDKLRIASIVSLGQLHTPEAMELIKKGLEDKRTSVKRMCEIIIKLDKE